jgi:predicted ester cyclase
MPDSDARSEKERLARLYCELWSSGDVNIVNQIFPSDAQHYAVGQQPWGEFITSLRKDFPDLSRPLEETYIDGDVLVIRSRLQGTHTGGPGFFHFPPTGVRMDIPAVTGFRVTNGLLSEELWSEYNLQSVERQMASAVVSDYLEKAWGEGQLGLLSSHVASGHVLHLNGGLNAVEGRRRLNTYISETRTRWDEGVFHVDEVVAGGEWGERVAYRWTAAEPSGPNTDSPAVSGLGFARLLNGVIVEEWLQMN